ncbi:MAG: hypothetical protein AMXMBFR84_44690 [Candidatus Hydrogenedentota bacterium]
MAQVPPAEPSLPDVVEFNKHVRPILSNSCYMCHGPDKNQRKADLRLDVRENALAERNGVRSIVAGDPGASEIVRRMRHEDPAERMPPASSERTVTPEQIALLERWIAQGAEYEPHWAWIAPKRVSAKEMAEGWARNDIDRFILAELARRGLSPANEADRVTLIRRVSFDLIGLPPTPSEVDSFVSDTSHDAYERLVDRLLGSPAYGERMAVNWLDQVRYADSNGYHSDEERSVYPYRDYVIKAFNENKPYDQFTREQLAGDLLPDATIEQRVASGFNRMNQITAEGGAQEKEYLAKYAADRVRALSSVWLGVTMGCAECHDHKFDPYTTRDFYSLEAFFADIDEVGVYPGRSQWLPTLPLPTADERAKEGEYRVALAELERELAVAGNGLWYERDAWEASIREDVAATGGTGWQPVKPSSFTSEAGASLALLDDFSILAREEIPFAETYTVDLPTSRQNITGVRLELLPDASFAFGLTRERDNVILNEITVSYVAPGQTEPVPVTLRSAEANQGLPDKPVSQAIDGNAETQWRINSPEKGAAKAVAVIAFEQPLAAGPGSLLRVQMVHKSPEVKRAAGRFRLSLTTSPEVKLVEEAGLAEHLYAIVLKAKLQRTAEESAQLDLYYRNLSPTLNAIRAEIAGVQKQLDDHMGRYASTLVTRSVPPRPIRILPRGNWLDESGEIVEPAIPASLPPLNVQGRRATRLDLANWLVSPENPLTARVFVNRLWKQFFGTGISKVLDDLGAQGEWPVHPELLDWLAVEFREGGWDVKHMVRLIATSATYRQASDAPLDLRQRDPYNRLVARQSRIRLEAEFVRDNALSVSGLLVPAIGGRSVRPYQPEGYYDNLNFPKRTYEEDSGDNLYRRGLYTHWQRSFLHPAMIAFDAPSREECTAERVVSNTPLQALVLLNDPVYVEAARAFAERIVREGGVSSVERLTWAYRWVLSRVPSEAEFAVMTALLDKHRSYFDANVAQASAAISTGAKAVPVELTASEVAAWTSVSRVLLNLHETITRN